jgi:hypothetical protein
MQRDSMMRRLSILSVAAITMLAALAGCASDATPSQSSVPLSVRQDLDHIFSPDITVESAREQLIAQCLHLAGFDIPKVAASIDFPESSFNVAGLTGLFRSLEQASSVGYKTTIRDDASNVFDSFAGTLSPSDLARYNDARFGGKDAPQVSATMENGSKVTVPTEGCHALSEATLFGSAQTSLQIGVLTNEVLKLADNDIVTSSMNKARDVYVSCMAKHGFTLTGLFADNLAQTMFGKYRSMGMPPSSEEQRLATTDEACQHDAEFDQKVKDAVYSSCATWVNAHQEMIAQLARATSSAEAKATSILDEPLFG